MEILISLPKIKTLKITYYGNDLNNIIKAEIQLCLIIFLYICPSQKTNKNY
jgi:hypothetical protein